MLRHLGEPVEAPTLSPAGDPPYFKSRVLRRKFAVILSEIGAKMLSKESAAIDFVREAFGHLKAIGVDRGGQLLLESALVKNDAGVCDISNSKAFITAAKTRQWEREASVRTLA